MLLILYHFRNDVVPIVTSGACGCHAVDNGKQILFIRNDTIQYSTILSRSTDLSTRWPREVHTRQKEVFSLHLHKQILVIKWYDQGAKDDYMPPPIAGDVTYQKHIPADL